MPETALGLLTVAVQALAGGPYAKRNGVVAFCCARQAGPLGPTDAGVNLFTAAVIAVLVMLSIILTGSVLYPDMSGWTILAMLGSGATLAVGIAAAYLLVTGKDEAPGVWSDDAGLATWRMPPLHELPRARMTPLVAVWIIVLAAIWSWPVGWCSRESSSLGFWRLTPRLPEKRHDWHCHPF
jgi:hypothetical protein